MWMDGWCVDASRRLIWQHDKDTFQQEDVDVSIPLLSVHRVVPIERAQEGDESDEKMVVAIYTKYNAR